MLGSKCPGVGRLANDLLTVGCRREPPCEAILFPSCSHDNRAPRYLRGEPLSSMADKKIEKALYGPSTTEVALGAILGLAAGLLAACVYLVFRPVLQVKEMPKEDDVVRGAIYFIPGS